MEGKGMKSVPMIISLQALEELDSFTTYKDSVILAELVTKIRDGIREAA